MDRQVVFQGHKFNNKLIEIAAEVLERTRGGGTPCFRSIRILRFAQEPVLDIKPLEMPGVQRAGQGTRELPCQPAALHLHNQCEEKPGIKKWFHPRPVCAWPGGLLPWDRSRIGRLCKNRAA